MNITHKKINYISPYTDIQQIQNILFTDIQLKEKNFYSDLVLYCEEKRFCVFIVSISFGPHSDSTVAQVGRILC